MITYKIHLIRTGSTSARLRGLYVGQTDCPLCDKGKDELFALKKRYDYPRADIAFTSPLSRCVQTADILYPDVQTQIMSSLSDLHLGEFEGKTPEDLSGDPAFDTWLENSLENPAPDGEALPDFSARIIAAMEEIFTVMMDGRIKNAAVVSHAGVIMTLLSLIGLPEAPPHEWLCPNGYGYTILMTPQMWMRDGRCEVSRAIPNPMHDMS